MSVEYYDNVNRGFRIHLHTFKHTRAIFTKFTDVCYGILRNLLWVFFIFVFFARNPSSHEAALASEPSAPRISGERRKDKKYPFKYSACPVAHAWHFSVYIEKPA